MSFRWKLLDRWPVLAAHRQKYRNFDEAVLILAVSLVCGFGAGAVIGGSHFIESRLVSDAGEEKTPLLRRLFAPIVAVSGEQEDGSFVLSDFESLSDFRIWRVHAAKLEIAPENAAEGRHSARVYFYGNTRMAGVSIEDYFSSRYAKSDWSKYRTLRFYLYNPQDTPERVILQLKDRHGKVFKKDLRLLPRSGEDFTVSLEEVRREIDVRGVGQFNLFLWDVQEDRRFYLDHLRLIR